MPEMDGIEATRRIRAQGGPMAAVPIVALTANAFADDAERCAAAGMSGHLAKPINPARLSALLADVAGGFAPKAASAEGSQDDAGLSPAAAVPQGAGNAALARILADLADLDRRLVS